MMNVVRHRKLVPRYVQKSNLLCSLMLYFADE